MTSGSLVFGRYRLDQQVGVGGMGVVWRATDELLHQEVALKRVALAGRSDSDARLVRERTLREARVAAQLRGHPHVVALYDVEVDEENAWLVLEYLPSRSLGEIVHDAGVLGHGEVARVGADIADALAAAHERTVLHRDVTPGNVLISPDGAVKLTDFGISHLIGDPKLTQAGSVSGTLAYLAPEVATSGESSPASDVFSLGATLYAALEGQPPFGMEPNAIKQLNNVRAGKIRAPKNAGPLQPLLLRLLAVDPADRPDAGEARDELTRFATDLSRATTNLPAALAGTIARPRGPAPGPARPGARPPASGQPGSRPPGSGQPGALSYGSVSLASVLLRSVPPGSDTHRSSPSRNAWLALGAATLAAVLLLWLLAALPERTVRGTASAGPATSAPASSPEPAPSGLPDSIGSISVDGDASTVDPCPLINSGLLGRFGRVGVRRGPGLASCQARITTANGGDLRLDVVYAPAVSSIASLGGKQLSLGGITLVRASTVVEGPTTICRNILVLSDNTPIYLNAYRRTGPEIDLCALTEAATTGAANQLAQHGVTFNADAAARFFLARANACTVPPPAALRGVPGIDPAKRRPGFGNWSCFWGDSQPGRPRVSVYFQLDTLDNPNGYGRPVPIAGRKAYQRPARGQNNPSSCSIYVAQNDGNGDGDRTELVLVTVDSPGETGASCRQARDIATGVQNGLR